MGQPFVRSAENWDCLRNTPIPFSTECPSLFRWNGHQYLLVGWCGYFRTKTPGGELFDAVAAGENVYDGLGVPMVCDYKDGRKLIAGWIRHIGWGSVIIHRELIQDADGKLSMKWLPEMLPRTTGSNLLTNTDLNQNTAALEADKSYLISMQINPGTARPHGCRVRKRRRPRL